MRPSILCICTTDRHGNLLYDDSVGRIYAGGMNLIKQLELNKEENNQFFLTQNFRADVKLPAGFSFNTTATFSGNWARWTEFFSPLVGDGQAYGGILRKQSSETYTLNWNQILNWDKTFNLITLHGMLGHEYYMMKSHYLYGKAQSLIDPASMEFFAAAKATELSSNPQDYMVEGYFGQFTADYDNRCHCVSTAHRCSIKIIAGVHSGALVHHGASIKKTL